MSAGSCAGRSYWQEFLRVVTRKSNVLVKPGFKRNRLPFHYPFVENQSHKAVVSGLFLMKQIISVVFLDEQPAHFSVRVGNSQVIVDPAEPDLFSILFFVEVETIAAAYTFFC